MIELKVGDRIVGSVPSMKLRIYDCTVAWIKGGIVCIMSTKGHPLSYTFPIEDAILDYYKEPENKSFIERIFK